MDRYDAFKHFADKHNISMSCEIADSNPQRVPDSWDKTAQHSKITLKRSGKRCSFYWSQGQALPPFPELADVLENLHSDLSFRDYTFEEFCSEFGYSIDSIATLKTYKQVAKLNKKLVKFFGEILNEFMEI